VPAHCAKVRCTDSGRRMTPEIRVAIIEDQRRTREGLATLINGTAGYRTVGAWNSVETALGELEADPPDMILVDIMLRGMSGIDGVRQLRSRYPALQILMRWSAVIC
jgi:DNA-binding NarL/FixJ family response regulator